MNRFFSLLLIASLALASCGGKKDEAGALTEKKAKLEELKKSSAKDAEEMKKLQDEIAKLDPAAAGKAKLVAVTPVGISPFSHYIDLQGMVDADNISYISPRLGPAQVKSVLVQEGQAVRKGQLLLKLDDAIPRQQLTAARTQLNGIRTQLTYAKDLAKRQQNLWDQGIGTQVQLLTAKTNVQGLEDQLAASQESVKVAQEQLNTSNVYSDVAGIADIVDIRVGEIFSGSGQRGPQIKIVNTSSLKVKTIVPESYVTKLRRGAPAEVTIADAGRVYNSTVSLISQSVEQNFRGFIADIMLPYDPLLKPNQAAKVRIQDYSAGSAIVIPLSTVQSDETGKYVFVLTKGANGKESAQKKSINLGEVYGSNAEVKTGLNKGDLLITEGYQGIYEGQSLTTQLK